MRVTSTIWFHSDPTIFGAVRRFVVEFVRLSGGSEEDAAELEVATGEALANAYLHAYRGTHGPLRLQLTQFDEKVEISLHDEGGAAPGTVKIPRTLAEAGEHRGLYLVGKMTDRAEIVHSRHGAGGTTVRMVKHVNKVLRLTQIVGLR